MRTGPLPERRPFGSGRRSAGAGGAEPADAVLPHRGRRSTSSSGSFGELYGVGHVVTSTSGTSAIHVALGALNPDPGDEVITTPISDMGTVAPIVLQNCVPVFADVDPATFNLDPDDVEAKITDRTRAIIVVHCWGQAADMDRFVDDRAAAQPGV